jgi:hypothetical protein
MNWKDPLSSIGTHPEGLLFTMQLEGNIFLVGFYLFPREVSSPLFSRGPRKECLTLGSQWMENL